MGIPTNSSRVPFCIERERECVWTIGSPRGPLHITWFSLSPHHSRTSLSRKSRPEFLSPYIKTHLSQHGVRSPSCTVSTEGQAFPGCPATSLLSCECLWLSFFPHRGVFVVFVQRFLPDLVCGSWGREAPPAGRAAVFLS